jgi:hypothetical protein
MVAVLGCRTELMLAEVEMALQVLGVGWSRTGTFSLKLALETLGYGPCYHMHELFKQPRHIALWKRAANAPKAWDELFGAYAAACDAPACVYWRELVSHYPNARVVLTTRNSADWYASMRGTVVEMMERAEQVPDPLAREVLAFSRGLTREVFFGGDFDDVVQATSRFEHHVAAVRASVSPERLLVYNVEQGWGPLCEFLGTPIPNTPFPFTNDRSSFRARAGLGT